MVDVHACLKEGRYRESLVQNMVSEKSVGVFNRGAGRQLELGAQSESTF